MGKDLYYEPHSSLARLHEAVERAMTTATDPFNRREQVHAAIDAWHSSELESAVAEVRAIREWSSLPAGEVVQ